MKIITPGNLCQSTVNSEVSKNGQEFLGGTRVKLQSRLTTSIPLKQGCQISAKRKQVDERDSNHLMAQISLSNCAVIRHLLCRMFPLKLANIFLYSCLQKTRNAIHAFALQVLRSFPFPSFETELAILRFSAQFELHFCRLRKDRLQSQISGKTHR